MLLLAAFAGVSSAGSGGAAAAAGNGRITIINQRGARDRPPRDLNGSIVAGVSAFSSGAVQRKARVVPLLSIDWAPDGRRLAFSASTMIAAISTYNGLHVLNTWTGRIVISRATASTSTGHRTARGPPMSSSRGLRIRSGRSTWCAPMGQGACVCEPGARVGTRRLPGLPAASDCARDERCSGEPGSGRPLRVGGRRGRQRSASGREKGSRSRLVAQRPHDRLPRFLRDQAGYARGRDVTPLTGACRCRAIGVAGQPVWSPDGRKIALGNRRGVHMHETPDRRTFKANPLQTPPASLGSPGLTGVHYRIREGRRLPQVQTRGGSDSSLDGAELAPVALRAVHNYLVVDGEPRLTVALVLSRITAALDALVGRGTCNRSLSSATRRQRPRLAGVRLNHGEESVRAETCRCASGSALHPGRLVRARHRPFSTAPRRQERMAERDSRATEARECACSAPRLPRRISPARQQVVA